MADMRDRLAALVEEAEGMLNNDFPTPDMIAEYLIEHGVIVAPMPMAEWLRKELTEYVYKRCIEEW